MARGLVLIRAPLAIVVTAALLAVAEEATSNFVRDGVEFQVNTFTSSSQFCPAVVATPDSDEFIVAWSGLEEASLPANRIGVVGHRFRSNWGRLGGEFQINQDPSGVIVSELCPAIAATGAGAFVVVWESYRGRDGDQEGIFGRRLGVAGTPVGDDFLVNDHTTGRQIDPEVAVFPDGGFVVVWTDSQSESYLDDSRLFGRHFNTVGAPTGAHFVVASESGPIRPALASLPQGRFIVVWQAVNNSGTGEALFAQRFESTGEAVELPIEVGEPTMSSRANPAIATDEDGRTIVAWTQIDAADEIDVRGVVLDDQLLPVTPEFLVNTYTSTVQDQARVTAVDDGSFVVTWKSYDPTGDGQDGNGRGVFARHFARDGVAVDAEHQVNTYTLGDQGGGRPRELAIANSAENGFIIVWSSEDQDGDRSGIFGQRYCVETISATCGDATCRTSLDPDSGVAETVTATDALLVLNGAIGLETCVVCRCDVNNSSDVTATDALLVLRKAVGNLVTLVCPSCS